MQILPLIDSHDLILCESPKVPKEKVIGISMCVIGNEYGSNRNHSKIHKIYIFPYMYSSSTLLLIYDQTIGKKYLEVQIL